MPRKRSLSPATAALAAAGVAQAEIAQALGASQQTVSNQLAGRAPASPGLIPVVRALAGPDAAAVIAGIVAESRAAQGLPPRVVDGSALDSIAAALVSETGAP